MSGLRLATLGYRGTVFGQQQYDSGTINPPGGIPESDSGGDFDTKSGQTQACLAAAADKVTYLVPGSSDATALCGLAGARSIHTVSSCAADLRSLRRYDARERRTVPNSKT